MSSSRCYRACVIIFATLGIACCGYGTGQAKTLDLPYFPYVQNRYQTMEQENIDVVHYDIDLAFNFTQQLVRGTVTVTFASLTDRLEVVLLDATEVVAVEQVTTDDGGTLRWTYENERITVTLPTALSQGEQTKVTIVYEAVEPPTVIFYSQDNLYTFSDPWFARTWWPCKDYPDDKATYDILLSVPDGLRALSNGKELETTAITCWDEPYTRYHWQATSPMTTFNFFVVAGLYEPIEEIWEYEPGKTMPVVMYALSQQGLPLTTTIEMLDYFSSLYGPYPFPEEKYGITQWMLSGASMEHQTLVCLGGDMLNSNLTLAHELSHQWFGNCLSIRDWRDIWLAEGFAEYGEQLWVEHSSGLSLPLYMRSDFCGGFYALGSVLRPNETGDALYFFDHCSVYVKGANVLHMLRHIVGEDRFFQIIRTYVAENRHGVVETADFIEVCERCYGKPVDWFFDPWLNRAGKVSYRWSWGAESGSSVRINVEQRQTSLYRMPVDFRIECMGTTLDTTLWIDDRYESFSVPVDGTVTSVVLDPDFNVYCTIQEVETSVAGAPVTFPLLASYPNPFNAATTVTFSLPALGFAELVIYNLAGQKIRTLVSGHLAAGAHQYIWDSRDDTGMPVSSGVYIARLISGEVVKTNLMTLVK